MNNFSKCFIIESTYIEDKLIIPRNGECKLEIRDGYGDLFLRFKNERPYFDSEDEQILINHKVLVIKCFS
jgi:hypothetical protein